MKNRIVLLFTIFAILLFTGASKEAQKALKNVKLLHHSSVIIELGGKVIYIDPYKLNNTDKKADIVLVTHGHPDHFSPEDIAKIAKPEAVYIVAEQAAYKWHVKRVEPIKPGETVSVGGIKITAVPAYNIKKPFHPKKDNMCGFVVEYKKTRIYHAGDTDFIPEMKALKNITIALVPVSTMFVMTPSQAADAINSFKPEIAVPMHYGMRGKLADAEKFVKLVKPPVEAVILPVEEPLK